MQYNFARHCMTHGAVIRPLMTDPSASGGFGLCNPSVLDDGGTARIILRNVNFAMWCCDDPHRFTSPYGPLCYMTRTDDRFLRTRNFLCELSDSSLDYKKVDTSRFDWEPQFEMAGHEDMRLVRWDGRLYGTGVQRDWNPTGVGRMQLSELDPETGAELSRVRIKAPGDDSTYCEKNWMPILDMPFHYVKWCDPLVIVKVDPTTGGSEVVLEKPVPTGTYNLSFDGTDIRGSSQVVPWGDNRIALVHRCRLWFNEKGQKSDTDYFTQFVVWDGNWNVVAMSEPFKFAGFGVEFTCGLSFGDGVFRIPFALQDNMAFLLDVSEDVVVDFIFGGNASDGGYSLEGNTLLEFFGNTADSSNCEAMGRLYYGKGHYASAFACFQRACEYDTFRTIDDLYACMWRCGMCLKMLGNMGDCEKSLWLRMIELIPNRSDAYTMLSEYYEGFGMGRDMHTYAKLAYGFFDWRLVDGAHGLLQYAKSLYWTERYFESEVMIDSLVSSGTLSESDQAAAVSFVKMINDNKANRYRVL